MPDAAPIAEPLPITVVIAVKNEAANMRRCLAALAPVARVLVVDSHSTDDTPAIAREMGAEVVNFCYGGGFPKKRQWALDTQAIATPWVLLLDADEFIPETLWAEIRAVVTAASPPADAFLIEKGFHFLGRRFRFGGFSHRAVLLFRTGSARFEHLIDEPPTAPDMEVHERLIVAGKLGALKTPLIHDDLKHLEAYIARHNAYSTWEARVRDQFLRTGQWGHSAIRARLFGNSQERRRFLKSWLMRVPGESWLWFVYHYWLRLAVLEGRAGLIACQIRAAYIAQVRAKLYEMTRGRQSPQN